MIEFKARRDENHGFPSINKAMPGRDEPGPGGRGRRTKAYLSQIGSIYRLDIFEVGPLGSDKDHRKYPIRGRTTIGPPSDHLGT